MSLNGDDEFDRRLIGNDKFDRRWQIRSETKDGKGGRSSRRLIGDDEFDQRRRTANEADLVGDWSEMTNSIRDEGRRRRRIWSEIDRRWRLAIGFHGAVFRSFSREREESVYFFFGVDESLFFILNKNDFWQ